MAFLYSFVQRLKIFRPAKLTITSDCATRSCQSPGKEVSALVQKKLSFASAIGLFRDVPSPFTCQPASRYFCARACPTNPEAPVIKTVFMSQLPFVCDQN